MDVQDIPDCDFVSWYKPIPQECPNEDSKFMQKRYTVKKGNYLKCPECGEEIIQPEVEENEED